jgi:hypothetical protein
MQWRVSLRALIIIRPAKLKVFRDLGVFGCDLVGASANAFAANLAAITRDDAKDFAVTLAAEGAVSVTHDANSDDWPIPHSE